MPWDIRKNSKGKYDLLKESPSGSWRKVGESNSKEKAEAWKRKMYSLKEKGGK